MGLLSDGNLAVLISQGGDDDGLVDVLILRLEELEASGLEDLEVAGRESDQQ